MTQPRKTKRSRHVALTTLTAVSTALASCGSTTDWGDETAIADPVDATPFASVAECAASGTVPEEECRTAYQQAKADDWTTAPRFDARALCEEQYGEGQCEQRSGNGGSWFSPLLTGFLIGNMFGGGGYGRYYTPLYRDRRSNLWYTGGGSPLHRYGGGYQVSRNAFQRPVSTPRVQTRSSVVSRGGFGGRVSASSGSRGFGGGGGWGG